jgi:hypothetical protein
MSELDFEKLLGGFAADTLTPEEKQRLYSAALQDQRLFNALADEQALKELLTDPAVRRRLLQTLNQAGPSGASGPLLWLDWFRRPANVAWAGGLAAAAIAVVLGAKVYQDSLKQTAQSIATEESRPALQHAPAAPSPSPSTPHTARPQPEAKIAETPASTARRKDASPDRLAKGERAASPTTQERKASDSAISERQGLPEQDAMRQYTETPAIQRGKDAMDPARSAPPASALAPAQAPAGEPGIPDAAPTVSARSLFYGKPAPQLGAGLITQDKKLARPPLPESAPQANRPDGRLGPFSDLGRTTVPAMEEKPLGLRYSFVVQDPGGLEHEVDAKTAATSLEPVRLTLETNQDAYLQVWEAVEDSLLQLQFPDGDSTPQFIKIVAGQRQTIPLSREHGPVTLFVRLSRVPQEPPAKRETLLRDRRAPDGLHTSNTVRESVTRGEDATYAVNRDLSSDQLVVDIVTGP